MRETLDAHEAGPQVSVVIPHLNDLVGLEACLTSLAAQSFPADRFEIVVADNGSTCGLSAVETVVAGRATLVAEPRPGAGPARNAAVAAARGTILAFTDADCRPEPDWLERGVAALRPGAFMGGGITVTVGDPARPTPAEAFELVYGFPVEDYARREDYVCSCNLFVHAADFHRAGGFRALLSEDVEWCRRAIREGLVLNYDPGSRIRHPARPNWPALRLKYDRITLEAFHLARAEGRSMAVWRLKAVAVALSPCAQGFKALGDPRLSIGDRMAAVGVLVRLRLSRAAYMLRLSFTGGDAP
jgi:glycosyltransferase involved in cell wall biosynthesis